MKKKLYVIVMIITLVVSLLIVNVNAAENSFTTSLKASSNNVKKGEEVTVTVKVSDLNVGDKGINSFEAYLSVDDKVFEEISKDDIEGLNDCSVTYSKDNGKLKIKKVGFIKKNTDICEIILTAKNSTTASKGVIELKDIVASNSESEIPSDDVSLELSIGSSSNSDKNTNTDTDTNTNTNTNTGSIKIGNTTTLNKNTNTNTNDDTNTKSEDTNTNTNNSSGSQIISSVNRNNTNTNNTNTNTNNTNTNKVDSNETKEDKMPNTGIDDTIVKAILLVGLVGALGYIKLKSLDK